MKNGYSLIQVAELLGVKIRTVRQWVRDGKIEAIKDRKSGRLYVEYSEIKRLQER